MGQQQLLLVILVTIIVGIATVVAINIFGSAAEEANRDAIRQDLLAAAAQAQGVYSRPKMMGGAGGNFTISPGGNARLAELLRIPGSIEGNAITNENAEYTITGADETLSVSVDPNGSPGTWDMSVVRQDSGNWLTTITDDDGNETTMGTADATE